MKRLLNRRIVLDRRPSGKLTREDFVYRSFELGDIPDDHIVLHTVMIQIAPAARAVMTNTTAFDRTEVGDGILCALVGEVVITPPGGPSLGSLMTSYGLWEEYASVPIATARHVVPGRPLVENLGPLGMNGLTAYFGMSRLGNPQPGQTVVVSAAAGGVGHLAGQLARLAGARVVGITGSDAKNRRLQADYHFDHVVNHSSQTFLAELASSCPEPGVDVYFDNVGGAVLNAMLPLMARHGRIVCCGATSHYDEDVDDILQPGPRGIPQHLINRHLRIEGFQTADFLPEWDDALRNLTLSLEAGSLHTAVHVWHGLDTAPDALTAVLAGENFGQAVVRLRPDPPRTILRER